jgi:hypothetical protein
MIDPSARTQFHSFVLFAIARFQLILVALLLKASVMRLLGVPRFPLPSFISRAALARNCPGPADSFPPLVFLSFSSSHFFSHLPSSVTRSLVSSP